MQKLNRCYFSKEKVPQKCHFFKNLMLGRGYWGVV